MSVYPDESESAHCDAKDTKKLNKACPRVHYAHCRENSTALPGVKGIIELHLMEGEPNQNHRAGEPDEIYRSDQEDQQSPICLVYLRKERI